MRSDKFNLFKYIFSKELKSTSGRINLGGAALLIIQSIFLGPTIKIKDCFFYGVEGYPTKFVVIATFVYIIGCVFFIIIRDSKRKNYHKSNKNLY